ncbi:hypothetical protein PSA01_68110 [Pseudonocardia saturnea]|uniref:Uncharacterized protein n=1 Tax=Pseudonocardia saturnea TaxID=33909 RepID=A0ABQ0SA49_9PSEU|nr:hypothetical protein Pdca_39150 [Pseudonocardia autotrophica]GEC29782.1 hypothetical protein PSA01_68110 [Pseudonocardia saturnea]
MRLEEEGLHGACPSAIGPETPGDLSDRLVALAIDRDHVATELGRERLGHDVDPSNEERGLTGQESTEVWAVPYLPNVA